MISRLVAKAALVGFAASIVVAAPAAAAIKLTLDEQTAVVRGHSRATLTGNAEPGSTVRLWESAFVFNDLRPAVDWENGDDGPVTAVANPQGRWTIQRLLDSGFYFQVRSGDEVSEKRKFSVTQLPTLNNVAPAGNNTVTATILAEPGQPYLLAELQQEVNGRWVKVGEARTEERDEDRNIPGGRAIITATGVSGGPGRFRAYVNGDPANAVLPGAGAAEVQITVPGPVTGPPPPPPTTPGPKPPTTPGPKPPTTPGPKPPTTPAPVQPAVGSIRFAKIQYDSPGADSGSNGSLNTEWAKLTNVSRSAINLRDWTLRDGGNHVYKFAGNVTIGAGKSLFVLSGKGTNTATHRYWGRSGTAGYIWNNGSEFAFLRTASGKQIAYCHWPNLGKGYTTC